MTSSSSEFDAVVTLMTVVSYSWLCDSSVILVCVTIVYPRACVVTAVINCGHDAGVIRYWDSVIGSVLGLAVGLVVGLVLVLMVVFIIRCIVVNPWLEQVVSKVEHLVSNHGTALLGLYRSYLYSPQSYHSYLQSYHQLYNLDNVWRWRRTSIMTLPSRDPPSG